MVDGVPNALLRKYSKSSGIQKGGREFIKNTDKNDKGDRGCSQKRNATRSKFFCAHVFAIQFKFISP